MDELQLRCNKIWAWCVGLSLGMLILGSTVYNTSYWYFITAYGYQQQMVPTPGGYVTLWIKQPCKE